MSVFVVPKNLFLRTYSVFSTQTPTLIGCNLLTIHQLGSLATSPSCPAAISEALNYDTVSCLLTQESQRFSLQLLRQEASRARLRRCLKRLGTPRILSRMSARGLRCNSLTMTYFHTGICTIIGAKSFHGPVRDGKEWDQLAMVVRHNGLLRWPEGSARRIHRVDIVSAYLDCVAQACSICVEYVKRTFLMQWVCWGYDPDTQGLIKGIGSSRTGN